MRIDWKIKGKFERADERTIETRAPRAENDYGDEEPYRPFIFLDKASTVRSRSYFSIVLLV
jgi:hypothetical protein